MRTGILTPVALLLLASCAGSDDNAAPEGAIYHCDEYTLYPDSVVQGPYTARALSATHIVTDYRSDLTAGASPVVRFRFSLNSRDNEMPRTMSHTALVGANEEYIYTLGTTEGDPAVDLTHEGDTLAVNTPWTVRVDMRPVLRDFAARGYHVTATGDTIPAADFKGLWINGSVEPLTWDFDNLWNDLGQRRLHDRGDSIYETTLTLNPPVQRQPDPTGWSVDSVNTAYPQYSSDQLLVDALYNMAIDEIVSDIRPDETFRAGKEWDGVWTRDVAYSIYLSLAMLDPERSLNSLRAKVKDGRIVQDTGTGGAWPVSTDRVVWALAAWEVYLATGDRQWLAEAYDIVRATLDNDLAVAYDTRYGLMHGEQSYLDWREQTYPYWLGPMGIYSSMTLGTNVLFARSFAILSQMAAELGLPAESVDTPKKHALAIADAINKELWQPDQRQYAAYLYTEPCPFPVSTVDNLGQSLAILFDVATPEQAAMIVESTARLVWGTPSVFPQQGEVRPYHNDAVWPFVQAYVNLAGARSGNMEALTAGLAALYRPAALFATNKELFVAANGDYRGTAVNSDAQLWSAAGNAAMPLRVYAGMQLTPEGITFAPAVPHTMPGTKTLKDVKYRRAQLDITVNGTGTRIAAFEVDGTRQERPFLPADIEGRHTVTITLEVRPDTPRGLNILKQQVYMPGIPVVRWTAPDTAVVTSEAKRFDLYVNGVFQRTYDNATIILDSIPDVTTQYNIVPVVEVDGRRVAGFSAPTHLYVPQGALLTVPATADGKPLRLTTTANTRVTFLVDIPEEGEWMVDARYSNGSGPVNTDNRCAIRTLMVNDAKAGTLVMPQRGTGEWLSAGYSNPVLCTLKKGTNLLTVEYLTPQNVNMNGADNTALLHSLRLIRQ